MPETALADERRTLQTGQGLLAEDRGDRVLQGRPVLKGRTAQNELQREGVGHDETICLQRNVKRTAQGVK